MSRGGGTDLSQWAKKAFCRSVFFTIWHCIL